MTSTQALSLASLLIEFELESPAVSPMPEEWQSELRQARQALGQLKASLTKPAELPNEPKVKRVRARNKVDHWTKLTQPILSNHT